MVISINLKDFEAKLDEMFKLVDEVNGSSLGDEELMFKDKNLYFARKRLEEAHGWLEEYFDKKDR